MSLFLRLLALACLMFVVQGAVSSPKRQHTQDEKVQTTKQLVKNHKIVEKKGAKKISNVDTNKHTGIQATKRNSIKTKQPKIDLPKKKPKIPSKGKNLTEKKKSDNKKSQSVKKKQEVKKSSKEKPKKKSNAKSSKPMVVKEFPLSEIIFKGRASNEANAFIRTNSKIGKPLELVYERTRELDLNDIEERIRRRFIEYSKMTRR